MVITFDLPTVITFYLPTVTASSTRRRVLEFNAKDGGRIVTAVGRRGKRRERQGSNSTAREVGK